MILKRRNKETIFCVDRWLCGWISWGLVVVWNNVVVAVELIPLVVVVVWILLFLVIVRISFIFVVVWIPLVVVSVWFL